MKKLDLFLMVVLIALIGWLAPRQMPVAPAPVAGTSAKVRPHSTALATVSLSRDLCGHEFRMTGTFPCPCNAIHPIRCIHCGLEPESKIPVPLRAQADKVARGL